jgi:hypothetical protein
MKNDANDKGKEETEVAKSEAPRQGLTQYGGGGGWQFVEGPMVGVWSGSTLQYLGDEATLNRYCRQVHNMGDTMVSTSRYSVPSRTH